MSETVVCRGMLGYVGDRDMSGYVRVCRGMSETVATRLAYNCVTIIRNYYV